MYTVVMMAALTGSANVPDLGRHRQGCCGAPVSCYGCYGGWGCYGTVIYPNCGVVSGDGTGTTQDGGEGTTPMSAQDMQRFEKLTKGWEAKAKNDTLQMLQGLNPSERDAQLRELEDISRKALEEEMKKKKKVGEDGNDEEEEEEASMHLPAIIVVTAPANTTVRVGSFSAVLRTGTRFFFSPALSPDQNTDYQYEMTAEFLQDGIPVLAREQIHIRPGQLSEVNFVVPRTGIVRR